MLVCLPWRSACKPRMLVLPSTEWPVPDLARSPSPPTFLTLTCSRAAHQVTPLASFSPAVSGGGSFSGKQGVVEQSSSPL
eukprot:4140466-Pleurochrysis_carterae.AAC.1